ncbi:MAG: hypothetical protein O3C43_21715 [Verrucomicrobia bacterium]|nr:hypothetical protein [Verrucomicrobiota bacterium]
MKTITKTLVYLIGLNLVSLTAIAAKEETTSRDYQLPTYKVEDMTLPVPTKVVTPRLRSGLFGEEVKMLFTITDKGHAIHIRSSRPFSDNPTLAGSLSQVIGKWEFEPARDKNGSAMTVKVSLPVKVVRKGDSSGYTASLALGKPTLVAKSK